MNPFICAVGDDNEGDDDDEDDDDSDFDDDDGNKGHLLQPKKSRRGLCCAVLEGRPAALHRTGSIYVQFHIIGDGNSTNHTFHFYPLVIIIKEKLGN